METQQGVGNKGISTFLSFGAKNVQPQILEKMLVGRRKTVDLLEQYVREIAQNGVNHQVFIVGPRGAGKTHLLRVLYHRVGDLVQTRAVVVGYFAEEEYGISGYLDFLIRIINAFMRWYDADGATLESQLNILRETPESRQEYVAESIINDYVGDKPLLILSENFDTILEALGKQGQGQLRSWLYRHNRISIIATAQTTSPDLGREDRPFYGFFSTIHLQKLSYEDSLALLIALAETEPNPTRMLEHLAGKGRAQVRAIHELVKGNHRLLVTFYEFLKADTLADLSVIFMKTMNDLKPYYETFIRYLPAQQQKILHYLALAKIPQKGTDIAKNCFIATASLTKQLSELQRRHLIDALPDPTDKRNRLYDVSEPLLRIAIEIGEQREGITSLFIDFLALCYSHDEIKSQMIRFEELYLSEAEPLKKQKLGWEVEARDRALKLQMESGVAQKESMIKVVELMRLGNVYYAEGNYDQAVGAFDQAVEMNPNFEWIWFSLGRTHSQRKDYTKAMEAYQKTIRVNPENVNAWIDLGIIYCDEQGNYPHAVEAFQKAIRSSPENEVAWYNLGVAYGKQGNYPQAVEAYKESIRLNPDDDSASHNLGSIYDEQGDYSRAIEAYEKAVQLAPDNEVTWRNLGNTYYRQANYDQAAGAYQKAIQLRPDYGMTWINIGAIYCDQQGAYDQATKAFQKATQLMPENEVAWYNLGVSYSKQGNYPQAIKSYQKALKIKPTASNAVGNLAETIKNYLQAQTATDAELAELETWLKDQNGFEIVSTYVPIYRRVVFNNDEKALYELPKEQRIFFEREILKRSTE